MRIGPWQVTRANAAAGAPGWPRIGILHSFYRSASPSGENAAVSAQFRMLAEHGVDVTLIGVESDEATRSSLLKARTAVSVATGTGLVPPKDAGIGDLEVLHVHNTFPNISHRWLQSIDVPLIATVHNYRAFCAVGTFVRGGARCSLCVDGSAWEAVRHRCYRGSSLASAPIAMQQSGSHSWRSLLAGLPQVLVPGDPMRAVLEGLGMRNLVTLPQPVESTASSPSRDVSDRRWLFVGRLSDEKGVLELLRCWPEQEPLLIAGHGDLAEQVADVVATRRLDVALAGALPNSTVAELMRDSSGLVFPSRALEGAPLVYAEAMCAGLPVVAATANVLAEQVRVDGTGATFDLEDRASLADALRRTADRRAELSAQCTEVYRARYTPATWLEGLRRAYGLLLTGRGR